MAYTDLSQAADEIRERCNIVDVIGAVVPLKRSGSNYTACCPFHREKTPSFIVSEKKQIFTCFGCHETGGAIKFVQKYYNLSFPEAVRKLAPQYGVEIDDSYARTAKRKEPYYGVNRMAAKFYYDAFTKAANPGYDYMKGRGIEPKILAKFGIGYADEEWSSLSDYLAGQGQDAKMLDELGLCTRSQKDGKLYDKFRGRVMFPIFNVSGKVIGFGGRTIIGDRAKYLNSQESFIFEKKRNLYGLNLTKGEIQNAGYAVLVEGYMDVVGLYQGGVRNVAASLGTALTEEQARLLKKYTSKVVLCYDSDEAGTNAALRGIDVLGAAGLDVRVMHVDDGKDPDEYIKKHGADEFRALIDKNALAGTDYKLKRLRSRYDLSDISQGVRFLRDAASVIRALSPVEADLYIQRVAKENGISEGALRREVETPGSTPVPAARNASPSGDPPAGLRAQQPQNGMQQAGRGPNAPARGQNSRQQESRRMMEKTILRLCIQRSEFWEKAAQRDDVLCTPEGFEIGEALKQQYVRGEEFDLRGLSQALEEPAARYLTSIMESIYPGESEEKTFEECIYKLDRIKAEARIQEIMDILSIADGAGDEALNSLMEEMAALVQKYRK